MARIRMSSHALDQYRDRVSMVGSHRTDYREKASEWCDKAIKNASKVYTQKSGKILHTYGIHAVITDAEKSVVVTIKPAPESSERVPEVEEALKDTVKRQALKMVRPLIAEKHEIAIKLHEYELKRIRVHHPETKRKLTEKVEEMSRRLDAIYDDITAHSALAYRYGVNIEEEI